MHFFCVSDCAGKTQILGDTKQLMDLSLPVGTLSISLVQPHRGALQHISRSLYVLPRANEEAKLVLKNVLYLSSCNSVMREANII
jgi:hypothetical protein